MVLSRKSRKLRIIKVGRVLGYRGINGTLKVTPFYKGLSFEVGDTIIIDPNLQLTIRKIKQYKEYLYISVDELSENKEILIGKDVSFKGAKSEIISDNVYLDEDFAGKSFYSSIDNKYLGKLRKWFYSGAQQTLEIFDEEANAEILIPGIKDVFIKEIMDDKIIVDDSILRE